MAEEIYKIIADNIKKYRKLNHLTQEQLAEKLSLDVQYYSQLERGERNFTIEKIVAASSVFSINIEDIIAITPPHDDEVLKAKTRERIDSNLSNLTLHQLLILEKYITQVLPFSK